MGWISGFSLVYVTYLYPLNLYDMEVFENNHK